MIKNKRPHELIRRIAVSFEDLVNKAAVPTEMDLFSNALTDIAEQEEHIQKTMLNIKGRFGKMLSFVHLACKKKGPCSLEIHW